jgi:hypothetical protein
MAPTVDRVLERVEAAVPGFDSGSAYVSAIAAVPEEHEPAEAATGEHGE